MDYQSQIDATNKRIDAIGDFASLPIDVQDAIGERTDVTLTAKATLDFPSTLSLGNASLTIGVPGAVPSDPVVLGIPDAASSGNCSYQAWVSTNNIVTIRFDNNSAFTVNPAAGSFVVTVFKTQFN